MITATLGSFKEFATPVVRALQDHTVVDVPMFFESGEMKGRIAPRVPRWRLVPGGCPTRAVRGQAISDTESRPHR